VAPEEPVIVIPDDARELDRDVRALARERRQDRRRARGSRLLPARLRGRSAAAASGPQVVLLMLLVAVLVTVTSFVGLLRSDRTLAPQARPLAHPAVPAGQVGGLVPDGPVLTPAGWTTTRELGRPGALLLVPTPCTECAAAVDAVVHQLGGRAAVRLLGSGAVDPTGDRTASLRSGPRRSQVDVGVDVRDVLTAAYGGGGVTLVLVAPDGVVLDVRHGVGGATDLQHDRTLLRRA
jgi:hypothetical protein